MDKDKLITYAPWLVVALMFFFQYNIFVTPVQLEKMHLEILKEVQTRYATKETGDDLKNQLANMQFKIDEIYKLLSKNSQ